MSEIIILFLIGVALLAADVFVTSFVMAILGAVLMLVGCALAYRGFGFVGAAAAAGAALALLGATLYLELIVLPKTRLGRGLVVESTSGEAGRPHAEAGAVVGKAAEALTTLAPSGYVLVEGVRYEAFCQSGLAAKGDALQVVGVDNFRVIVKKTG